MKVILEQDSQGSVVKATQVSAGTQLGSREPVGSEGSASGWPRAVFVGEGSAWDWSRREGSMVGKVKCEIIQGLWP